MAADNSTGAPRQDFQLDFGQYPQNADNNLLGNGNPQPVPNDNVEVMMDLGSPSESSTKPSVNQVDFSMSFSLSSTPTSPLLLENFQFSSSSSSDESTESSTPQSSPTSTDDDEMLEVGINEIAHSTFVLRTNHLCHLRNETMINLTTDVNAPNMMRVEVEAPNSGTQQAEMAAQTAGMPVQPVLQHHHEPQSVLYAEILQPQMVDPSSQSSTFYGNHFGMNIQHNNMNNSFGDQQAQFYPPPYNSQTTMGTMDGRSSWNNHQQPWFSSSYNTPPQRPMSTTPSGPRYNQFMRANSFGSNGPSLQFRPVQPNIWHQVPAASNTYDPYYPTYSMAPAPPVYPRYQSFFYQYNHQASMAPNVYDTQGWNFMPPPDFSFQTRPQSFFRHQVPYGNGMNPHNYNSVLPGPSMPSSSRFQQFNGYNQHLNSANYGLSNVSDPQNYINPRQEPLLLTGPPQATDVPQEMMITHGSQNQQQQFSVVPEAPIMNSFRNQQLDHGEANGSIEAMAQLPDPLHDTSILSGGSVTSKPWINQEQQILISEAQEEGWQSRRRTHFEFGESSSSTSKRIKRETTTTEACPLGVSLGRAGGNTSGGAQHNEETSRFAHPRQIKSEIYDPKFEEMGLPIDPHLRMFMLNN